LGHAPQRLSADVALADVPVAIDTSIVSGARVVKMNGANVPRSYRALKFIDQRFQTILLADIVAGGKGVGSIKTNAERKVGACIHDFAQMLEAVANTLALSRSVLQKNFQTAELQAPASELKTLSTPAYAICFTGSARTAWMDHEIIDAKQNCPLNFFAKRSARLLRH